MREKDIENTGTRLNHFLSPSSQISPFLEVAGQCSEVLTCRHLLLKELDFTKTRFINESPCYHSNRPSLVHVKVIVCV